MSKIIVLDYVLKGNLILVVPSFSLQLLHVPQILEYFFLPPGTLIGSFFFYIKQIGLRFFVFLLLEENSQYFCILVCNFFTVKYNRSRWESLEFPVCLLESSAPLATTDYFKVIPGAHVATFPLFFFFFFFTIVVN